MKRPRSARGTPPPNSLPGNPDPREEPESAGRRGPPAPGGPRGPRGCIVRGNPRFLVVGHLNKAHGTKGELFVWPLTDHPDTTFVPGVVLQVAGPGGDEPDPSLGPLVLESVRPFRRGYLVRVRGITDRTAAELLRGRYLLRPWEDVEPLEEGELFYHQLLGMRVVTEGGEEVGEIVEVYELRPADLLEVRGPRGLCHIPFLESIVRRVDVEAGLMVVAPPEGLLDL